MRQVQEPRSHHPQGLLLAGPFLLNQLGRLRQPPQPDDPGDEAVLGQVGRQAEASRQPRRSRDEIADRRLEGVRRIRLVGVSETADEAPVAFQRGEDEGSGRQGRSDD